MTAGRIAITVLIALLHVTSAHASGDPQRAPIEPPEPAPRTSYVRATVKAATLPVEPIATLVVDRNHDTVPDRKGGPAKIRGIVLTGTHVLRDHGFQVFVQDASGGIGLFNSHHSDLTLVPGDIVEAWGEVSQYKGALQLEDVDVRRVGHGPVPAPIVLTTAQAEHWSHVGKRARVQGTVGAVNLDNFAMLKLTGDDGVPLQIYVPAPVAQRFDWKRWRPGARVSATGVMSIYKPMWPFDGGFQLVVTDPSDLVVIQPPPPEWHRWFAWAAATATLLLVLGGLMLHVMQRRQRMRARELSTLSALSSALADTTVGETQLARNACEILGAFGIVDAAAVYVFDDATRLHRIAEVASDERMRTALAEEPADGDSGIDAMSLRLAVQGLHAIGLHPLLGVDGPLGVLAAFAPQARRPSQMQERTLLAAAKLLAMALQNQRIRERALREAQALQTLVITDELTRLYNRRFLDEYLCVQVPLAERRGGGLAFVTLDIDHFKRVNDTYGHDAGDRVLMGIAGQLRQASRSCDLPVRMGGEEFLVVIAEHEIDAAMAFAERLRTAIEAIDFDEVAPGSALQVTVSIGVALFGLHGSDAAALMRASDEAMYASKRGGRNRVSLSNAMPAFPS